MSQSPKPVVLIILDGWGYSEQTEHNPILSTATPTFDDLMNNSPYALLHASGTAVGLPEGQMGNSEVGHLHIGAGRKVPQDYKRIDDEIASGAFNQNPALIEAINTAKENKGALHVLGLVSPGGVHSHEDQIMALLKLAVANDCNDVYLHALLDGRDTPPKSAAPSLKKFSDFFAEQGHGQVASIMGRYYAMDRDQRWPRTQRAYDCLTQGLTEFHATDALSALEEAYERGETDEFVQPTSIHDADKMPITIHNGDVVIFMNFRADRARQLTRALTSSDFDHFKREVIPKIAQFVTLTIYAKDINAKVAYAPMQLPNTLGEYLSQHGYRQLRIAETEKYAHVTYFLNGGREVPFSHEERELIPSPKVATYDLQPEMSANELTDKLIQAINSQRYDVIVCNYANPDMVGHTGIEAAASSAVSTIDTCIGRVIDAVKKAGGEALITADHGNIEYMFNPETGQPHTAHTNNLVPLIYVGRPAHFVKQEGALDDVAPTVLGLLGLEAPKEMTGENLLKFD